ncbi:MAG: carbon-nitrogen hydrolase family protein [Thiotrichales bacterium]|jgi:nitrilase|nr:carbon-nitrogen hydrolase family protein [Thiotrichales bacterium]MBT4653263.1 carbon-nitrogen hydrolase family protein [Thiotrichales bacterium]MBT7438758.1 carbon-nitrogen hydrolase family protein [Thiotrichales bacterium]
MKATIGVFQYKMQDEYPIDKINRLEGLLKENPKLDLLVCPELFISGYGSLKKINENCEKADGEYARKISSLAKQYSTAIVYGYPEISNNKLFNSAQLFDHNGISTANHRKKMLPPTADESKIFAPGQDNSIFSINGIKAAIVICYELEFPEIIRDLALQGVELIIAPTGQSSHWPSAARYNCRTRAFENGIFVAYANSTGDLNGISFMGESKIIGPDGLDLVNADQGEKLISAEIDTNDILLVREKLPYLNDSKSIK